MEWVLVAAGGALGAVSRFAVVRAASTLSSGFPLGTLLVNMVGCLLAGIFIEWIALRAPDSPLRFLVQVGFLGAFTTFSAFSVDNWQLLQGGQYAIAGFNIALNMVLSFSALVIGVVAARALL